MTGYIYKSILNEKKSEWTKEELVSNIEIEEEMFQELCDLLDKYKICKENYVDFNTNLTLRDKDGNTINYFCGYTKLPTVYVRARERAEREERKMTYYLYKSKLKQDGSWKTELFSPLPVTGKDINKIVSEIHVNFGRFAECHEHPYDTIIFTIKDIYGNVIASNTYKELLPWED